MTHLGAVSLFISIETVDIAHIFVVLKKRDRKPRQNSGYKRIVAGPLVSLARPFKTHHWRGSKSDCGGFLPKIAYLIYQQAELGRPHLTVYAPHA
jgi:hypothetical protein